MEAGDASSQARCNGQEAHSTTWIIYLLEIPESPEESMTPESVGQLPHEQFTELESLALINGGRCISQSLPD